MKQEKELKVLAVQSVGWLAAKRVLSQVLYTAANLVLVRLLFPADFGTFAIIQFLVTVSWVFADIGLGRALIQREKEPEPSLLRTVWWTQVGLAVLIFGVLWLVGPLLLSYYGGELGEKALLWLRLLVASQILLNMSSVSVSLLERRLLYGRVLVGDISGLFATQITTIFLAFLGFGVGSFVYGALLGKFISLVVFFVVSPWAWGLGWEWGRLKSTLSFGVPFQMSAWLGIINGAVIPVFVGRFPGPGGFSGPQAVGFVTWAAGVAAISTAVSGIIDQVLFPLMARLQKDPEVAGRFFARALRIVAVTTFGGAGLLFALAPEVIRFVYTPRWLPALPSLRLALLQVLLIALTSLAMNTLLAFGEAKFYRNMHAVWAVLQWVLAVPLVLILGFWGVNLAGVLVSLTALYAFFRLGRYLKISYLGILKIPLLASVATWLSTFFLARMYPVENIFFLFLFASIGSILYLSLIYLFMKREFVQDFRVAQNLVRGFFPELRMFRRAVWHIYKVVLAIKRGLLRQTDTWWDNQNYDFMLKKFLRDPIDGVNHPSRKFLRNWLKKHPNLTLFDVGCGPGVEYEGFLKYKIPVRYIGLDFSDTMLGVFKSRYPKARIIKGNMKKLPLMRKSVDVVLLRHVLEHIDDYEAVIKEAVRVARKQIFIVLFKNPTHKEVKKIEWGSWDNRLDLKELKEFLNRENLKSNVKRLPYPYPVPPHIEENTVISISLKA